MKKNKIEQFIEEKELILELFLDQTEVIATLYKKTDLCIRSFSGETMDDAINKAVNKFKQEEKCH